MSEAAVREGSLEAPTRHAVKRRERGCCDEAGRVGRGPVFARAAAALSP